VAVLTTQSALARPHARRHFEPTDLQLEQPGNTELDLELGLLRSHGPWRVVAPDYELDVGLTEWLELDLDGGYAVEGAPDRPFSFDHSAADALWPSAKLGIFDAADEELGRTYALGTQLGPRLPTFGSGHGLGAEALVLAGVDFGATSLALNLGGFVDPGLARGARRPIGVQSGLAWQRDLDPLSRYGLAAELASIVFVTREPAQLQVSFGPSYAPTRWLRLSLTGLIGFSRGSDRYGLLLGFAPRLPLWQTK
jgi:hypothetical protein